MEGNATRESCGHGKISRGRKNRWSTSLETIGESKVKIPRRGGKGRTCHNGNRKEHTREDLKAY